MNIAILSRNPNLYSTKRLVEAGLERGHHVRVIDHLQCYVGIEKANPTIHYKGEVLDDIDAIIPRIGASVTFYGSAIVRQFEMMHTFTANESQAIVRSRDKLRSNRGPLVLEVNSSPGLEGIEKATGINIAGKIYEYIELHGGERRKRKDKIGV